MTPRKRTKKVYRTVLALLRDRKRWGQHFLASHGRYCLIGAVTKVYGSVLSEDPQEREAARAARDRLQQIVTQKFGRQRSPFRSLWLPVDVFNDHPDTTHADILAVLRAARI